MKNDSGHVEEGGNGGSGESSLGDGGVVSGGFGLAGNGDLDGLLEIIEEGELLVLNSSSWEALVSHGVDGEEGISGGGLGGAAGLGGSAHISGAGCGDVSNLGVLGGSSGDEGGDNGEFH